MVTRFCPKCHQVREMRITETRKKTVEAGEKKRVKKVRTFHCATCNSFVCSEDGLEDEGEKNP